MTSKQRYYNREYARLIAQAKNLYNEMKLGSVFGEDTPSFEKILNYAGTKSGLKKPTKESIRALRRLQGVEGILWGVEKSISKRDKINREKASELRESYRESKKKISEAEKNLKKEAKTKNADLQKRQNSQMQLNAIATILFQLQNCKQVFQEQITFFDSIAMAWATAKGDYYVDRLQFVEDMISQINRILVSNDTIKTERLEKYMKEFYERYPGGLEPKQVYEDGEQDLENSRVYGLEEFISKADTGDDITPASDNEAPKDTMDDNPLVQSFFEESGIDISDLF